MKDKILLLVILALSANRVLSKPPEEEDKGFCRADLLKNINDNFYLFETLEAKIKSVRDYRLPKNVLPETYNITLETFNDDFKRFFGSVEIATVVVKDTDTISLHQKNLTLKSYSVTAASGREIKIGSTSYDNVTDIFTMRLQETVRTNERLTLFLTFDGLLGEEMNGLYRSSYYDNQGNRRWLATTQFEPVYARQAFPCFDEPGFKAKWNLRIRRPVKFTALTNMPKIATQNRGDYEIDIFQETPRMSSYLVAIVISDFSHVSKNGSNVAIWSKNSIIKTAEHALDFGTKVQDIFGKLFKMENPVPKTDMIAVPDFSAGAMENWGLITYREYLVTYDPQENSDYLQQGAASTIAHELAHMWFGNIMSPEWWEFTWLSEGFANYFQHIGNVMAEPSWQYDGRYYVDTVRYALDYDSSLFAPSISHPCSSPSDIKGMFGAITYSKGGSVIRMMAESFGINIFYESLQEYIAKNKYGNVRSEFLWDAIQTVLIFHNVDLKVSVKELMTNWINKPGHPVVFVDVKEDKINLSYERFLLEKRSKPKNRTSNEKAEETSSWYIPITYASSRNPNFSSAVTTIWMKDNMTIYMPGATKDWIIFNIMGAGFYRVNYDMKSWYRIIRTLNSKNYLQIHEFNRVAIIDDLFHLARADYLGYDVYLDALQYLPQEKNFLPIRTALSGLKFLKHIFNGYEDEQLLNNHILNLVSKQYRKLGHVDQLGDSKYDILLRGDLTSLLCYMNHDKCLAHVKKTFAAWRVNPKEKIPKNERPVVYCYAVQEGSIEDWEFLREQYKLTHNVYERLLILKSLSCTRNHNLLEKYLFMAMTNYDKEHQIHDQDSMSMFYSVIQRGNHGADYMLEFLSKHYDHVVKHYNGSKPVIQFLLMVSESFTTQDRIDKFRKYIDENLVTYKPIRETLEKIANNAEHGLRWYKKHSTTIRNWLYKTYPNYPFCSNCI